MPAEVDVTDIPDKPQASPAAAGPTPSTSPAPAPIGTASAASSPPPVANEPDVSDIPDLVDVSDIPDNEHVIAQKSQDYLVKAATGDLNAHTAQLQAAETAGREGLTPQERFMQGVWDTGQWLGQQAATGAGKLGTAVKAIPDFWNDLPTTFRLLKDAVPKAAFDLYTKATAPATPQTTPRTPDPYMFAKTGDPRYAPVAPGETIPKTPTTGVSAAVEETPASALKVAGDVAAMAGKGGQLTQPYPSHGLGTAAQEIVKQMPFGEFWAPEAGKKISEWLGEPASEAEKKQYDENVSDVATVADQIQNKAMRWANKYSDYMDIDPHSVAAQIADNAVWFLLPGLGIEGELPATIDSMVARSAKYTLGKLGYAGAATMPLAIDATAMTGVYATAAHFGLPPPLTTALLTAAAGGEVGLETTGRRALSKRAADFVVKKVSSMDRNAFMKQMQSLSASGADNVVDYIQRPIAEALNDAKQDLFNLQQTGKDTAKAAEKVADLTDKLNLAQTQREWTKHLEDISRYGANVAANTTVGAGIGGMFGYGVSPTGQEAQGMQGGVLAGGVLGGAFAPVAAYSGMHANRIAYGQRAFAEIGSRGFDLDSIKSLKPADQQNILALNGAAKTMFPDRDVRVLWGDDFLGAQNEDIAKRAAHQGAKTGEPVPQVTTPTNGFVDTAGNLILNGDALRAGVGEHEITHATQEFFGKLLNDKDPESMANFWLAYEEARGKSLEMKQMTPEQIRRERDAEVGRILLRDNPLGAFYGGKRTGDVLAHWGRNLIGKLVPDKIKIDPLLKAPYTAHDIEQMRERYFELGALAQKRRFLVEPTEGGAPPAAGGSRGAPPTGGRGGGGAPPPTVLSPEEQQVLHNVTAGVRRLGGTGVSPSDIGNAIVLAKGAGVEVNDSNILSIVLNQANGRDPFHSIQVPAAAPPAAPPAAPQVQHPDYESIRSQAEDAVRQKLAGSKAKDVPDRIARAGIEAAAQAHAQAVGPDSDLITWRTDKYGKSWIGGRVADPADPFHQMLLARAKENPAFTPEAVRNLNDLEANMGRAIAVDYSHAPEEGAAVTRGERAEARAEATAPERVAGEAAREKLTKSYVPTSITYSPKSNVFIIDGFSPDKLLNNANTVIDWAKGQGMKTYDGVNDPLLVQHIQQLTENHQNGYQASGKPIKGTALTPVEQTPGYKPHVIPKDYRDQLNVMMGNDTARTGLKGISPEQAEKQLLAKQNSPYYDPATGEVNKLRARMGDAAKGLEPVYERLRPELIDQVRRAPVADEETLRPSGFAGDRGQFSLRGLPRQEFVAAGLMPATGGAEGLKPEYREGNASARVSPSGYISNLFVRPEARGRGEGTALMRQIIADADRAGTSLKLHIGEQRADLKRFYEDLGFKETGRDQFGIRYDREPTQAGPQPSTLSFEEYQAAKIRATPKWNRTVEQQKLLDAFDAREKPKPQLMPHTEGPQLMPATAGFYTKSERAIEEKMPNVASADQLRGLLKNAGIGKNEMEWTGLNDLLENLPTGKVTKDEVRQWLRVYTPEVTTQTLGGPARPEPSREMEDFVRQDPSNTHYPETAADWRNVARNLNDRMTQSLDTPRQLAFYSKLHDEALGYSQIPDALGTQYQGYVLPGGENYRENLYHLKPMGPSNATTERVQNRLAELFSRKEEFGQQWQTESKKNQLLFERVKRLKDQRGVNDPEFIKAAEQYRYSSIALDDIARHRENTDRQIEMVSRELRPKTVYASPHFAGQGTNLLAHSRTTDRVTTTGSKMHFLEEMQSDWAQEARKKGVQQPVDPNSLQLAEGEHVWSFTDPRSGESYQVSKPGDPYSGSYGRPAAPRESRAREIAAEFFSQAGGVADMPFKGEAWKKFVLRQAIKDGVAEGKDSIGWTTGQQQADRYNLAQHVDRIHWSKNNDGTYYLQAETKTGNAIDVGRSIAPNKIADYVGAGIAKQITNPPHRELTIGDMDRMSEEDLAAIRKTAGDKPAYDKLVKELSAKYGIPPLSGVVSGTDLTLGGEGMKGFYDREIVNIANDIGKKFGAKVRDANIGVNFQVEHRRPGSQIWEPVGGNFTTEQEAAAWAADRTYKGDIRISPEDQYTVHELPITPQMRESIQTQGQPMFMPHTQEAAGYYDETKAILRAQRTADFNKKTGKLRAKITNNGPVVTGRTLSEIGNKAWEALKDPKIQADLARQMQAERANPNTPLTPEDFYELGWEQRGYPESAMLDAQRAMGGGVLNVMVEHIGDLIHRMADQNTFDYSGGYEYVKEKVDRGLRFLQRPYGFDREFNENMLHNAEYRGVPEAEFRRDVDAALAKYTEEHQKLQPLNRAQKLANDAAIAIGKKDWNRAEQALLGLDQHLGSMEDWKRFAQEGLGEPRKWRQPELMPATTGEAGLPEADAIAEEAHRGVLRSNGEPYKNHVDRVADAVTDPTHKIIAKLHDAVEDAGVSLDQIRQQFGDRVANGVDAVTRRDGETYGEFIQRASQNPDAVAVKLADLRDNMRDAAEQKPSLVPRYQKAIEALEGTQPRMMPQTQTDTPAFKKWFGESKAVDEEGKPLTLYHGSTHDFREFDPSKANIENDWGHAIYLTNTPEDVSVNYAGEGPDLTNRIEREAERIMQEKEEEPKWGTKEYDDAMAAAKDEARQNLGVEHGGAVYPVFAKMENPLELGGKNEPHWSLDYDEDTGEESGELVDLHSALMSAASSYYDAKPQEAFSEAVDKVGMDGRASDYINALRGSEGLQYATDDNGNLANHEIIRDTVERMGYDSIIDREVNQKFGSERRVGKQMEGMGPDTAHYILFDGKQLKSAIGNTGAFDPFSADITLMPATTREALSDPAKELDLSKPEHFFAVDHVVPVKGSDNMFTSVDSAGHRFVGEFDPNIKVEPKLALMPATRIQVTDPKTGRPDEYYRPNPLLGTGIDPKTVKGEKKGYKTFIMYLAASDQSGVVNVCKFATKDCIKLCLGKNGQGGMPKGTAARINKTKYWHYDPQTFLAQLDKEITREKAKAAKSGVGFAVRLNGTSDIQWENTGIMQKHPDVQFYDYTKYPALMRIGREGNKLPSNYHLTYSYTGLPGSEAYSKTYADHGINTAVVFGGGMPATFMGRPVIDGDVTDLRFLDPKGVIVGLHAKGPTANRLMDETPFVYHTPKEDVAIPYVDPQKKARIIKTFDEEAIDAIKDDPQYAPKGDQLKYFRGNPFLDPEGTGKQTVEGPKGYKAGGVVKGNGSGVYLIRHGCTSLNQESGKQSPDLIRGHADIPLDEQGHKQAEQLGKKLAGKGIHAVFSSDLSRAMHTAAPIAKANNAPLIPTYGLRPWDLGKHQGKPTDDVQPEIDRLIDNPDERAEGGESANEFKNRFLSTMHHIVNSNKGKKIAVVTHYRGTKLLGSLGKNGEFDPEEFKRKDGALEPGGHQFLKLEEEKKPMKGIS